MSHVDIQGKKIPGRGHSKDKGPEAKSRQACSRNCKEAMAGGLYVTKEGEVRLAMKQGLHLEGPCRP